MMAAIYDPMDDHKCHPIAKATNMGVGRDWWMGELLEPIPDHPEETHCLHITTPYKSVVWGVNLADLLVYATFAHIIHGMPINSNWLDIMAKRYQEAARNMEPVA
jgi:hypothetical protein